MSLEVKQSITAANVPASIEHLIDVHFTSNVHGRALRVGSPQQMCVGAGRVRAEVTAGRAETCQNMCGVPAGAG